MHENPPVVSSRQQHRSTMFYSNTYTSCTRPAECKWIRSEPAAQTSLRGPELKLSEQHRHKHTDPYCDVCVLMFPAQTSGGPLQIIQRASVGPQATLWETFHSAANALNVMMRSLTFG